jgi:hypothetical protein
MTISVAFYALAERPATISIILMGRPIGIDGKVEAVPGSARADSTVRVNGFQSKEAESEAYGVIRTIGSERNG